jgi:UDP-N-acetylmuramate--alanine ligase
MEISLNQDGSKVPKDTDLFVYTLALPEDHPERVRAKELEIPQETYFQALGNLMRESGKTCIAISGTHGKSSTTAMAAKVFIDAELDPSVILGTKTQDLDGKNWRKGGGEYFIVEACEYQRSFLHISPKILLITNITGDHFDAYKDMADYEHAFEELISKLPSDGLLISHGSDPACRALLEKAPCKTIDADSFPLPALQIPGKHMQGNARLVLALAKHVKLENPEQSLKDYRGCWRRTEIKGTSKEGALVIDDYGHHPNEVKATLLGLKEAYAGRRLICVFQPHTHDRVLKLYDQFLTAFSAADLVIIPNIYAARSDRDQKQVDPKKFVEDIAKGSSTEALYGESFEKTLEMLRKALQQNDVVVTMGAGDIWKVAEALL